jgi:hypothetical protein
VKKKAREQASKRERRIQDKKHRGDTKVIDKTPLGSDMRITETWKMVDGEWVLLSTGRERIEWVEPDPRKRKWYGYKSGRTFD